MLVGAALCTTLIAQSRVARAVGERIAHNDAARASVHILASEIRFAARADIRAVAPDSISARWIRASGVVCAVQGSTVWVHLEGMRELDSTKDSVALSTVRDETVYPASALTRDATRCTAAGGAVIYRLEASRSGSAFHSAIVFESGSYYMSQRALRYRLGGEGRQPLTEEYMRDGLSSFAIDTTDSSLPARLSLVIALKTGMQHTTGRTIRTSVSLPNSVLK